MLLFFLRHGHKETKDKPTFFKKLTWLGDYQIKKVKEILSKLYFDIVFVSPYVRTRESFLGLNIDYGKLVIKPYLSELSSEYSDVDKFIEELKKLPPEFVCLAVSHGNFQRKFLSRLLNVPYEKTSNFIFFNSSLSAYIVDKEFSKILFLNYAFDTKGQFLI